MSNLVFEFEVPEIRVYPVHISSSYDEQRGKRNGQDICKEESVPVNGRGEGSADSMEEGSGQSQDGGAERNGRDTVKEC